MNTKKAIIGGVAAVVMAVGGQQAEEARQIGAIHAKEGVSVTLVKGAMKLSQKHKQDVRNALIEEYDIDGYVDYDNFILHQDMIGEHYQEFEEPIMMVFGPGEFNNEEKIEKIHESLLNN